MSSDIANWTWSDADERVRIVCRHRPDVEPPACDRCPARDWSERLEFARDVSAATERTDPSYTTTFGA